MEPDVLISLAEAKNPDLYRVNFILVSGSTFLFGATNIGL